MSILAKNVRPLALIMTSAALFALAGCATNKEGGCCDDSATKQTAAPATPTTRMTVVNTVCPLSGEDFGTNDRSSEVVRAYKGENIGFCCPGCVSKFEKLSDEKKAAALTAAKANKAM